MLLLCLSHQSIYNPVDTQPPISCVFYVRTAGLPHAHILLIMAPGHKPHSAEEIDRLICAELPNPTVNPELHAKVCKYMLHGACGDINTQCPCMNGGKCKQSFPKDFQATSILPDDGYPTYR